MPKPGQEVTTAKICREYKKKYPDMNTTKLSRIVYAENSLLFPDSEAARSCLRYIEGKKGNNYREANPHKEYFRPKEHQTTTPYFIPKSDETPFEPYILKGHKRIAVLNDIHLPYHSESALKAAIDYAKKEKVDALLLNGDILDMFQLSRFLRDPRKRHFSDELTMMKDVLNIFSKQLKCKIYFKYGNHEERYEHFLFMKAKELIGVEEFELDNIIRARSEGIDIIKDKRIIRANGLNIIHGHEYTQGIFNPVNVARGLFLRGKTSAMQGHSHQTSEHTETDMNGKITTTWSVGCLCGLSPEYAPLNKWNHGFAIIDLDGKDFDVRNKRILKGRVL
jgi:predicted phosphodiesterase